MNQEELRQVVDQHAKWLNFAPGGGGARACFDGVDLRGVSLRGANLEGARFDRVDLRNANLSYASLKNARFTATNLRHANFGTADLASGRFIASDLFDSDFSRADLRFVTIIDSDVEGMNVNAADIRNLNLMGTIMVVLDLPRWRVCVQRETTQIGCQRYPHGSWLSFSDELIGRMSPQALPWWRTYKELVVAAIKTVKAQVAAAAVVNVTGAQAPV